ncbi:UNVERIFIED_CONTAM: hypothetical protein HDU68_001603 [Siphonaria sp. JEL0065]|nr:hypothetical protein HDU68_001603 [Siphonaria sp. JEL0065]
MAPLPPTADLGESHPLTKPPPQQAQQQTSVWVVRPGNSGRVLAVAAEVTPQTSVLPAPPAPQLQKSNSSNNIIPRDSLGIMSTSRIPRSLAISDMTEQFDLQTGQPIGHQQHHQKQLTTTSPTRDRSNIDDVNRRWDEMMKSTTPVSPLSGSVPGSAKNVMLTSTPSSATINGGRDSRGSGSGASAALTFGNTDTLLGASKSGSAVGSIGDSKTSVNFEDPSKKTKKRISFSEKVMYRSLSSIDMDQASLADLHKASLMAVSELWSDDEDQDEEYDDDGYQNTEDDTLYSDEGNDWPKNDEFESIVDGPNIMSLPLDDDDDIRIPSPTRQLSIGGQSIISPIVQLAMESPMSQRLRTSPPNQQPDLSSNTSASSILPVSPSSPISRNTFNASPVHRFLKTQNMVPLTPNRFDSPTPPQATPQLAKQASKDDVILSSLTIPQTIINNQIINLQIPSDIQDLVSPSDFGKPPKLDQKHSSKSPKSSSPPDSSTNKSCHPITASPQQRMSPNTHGFSKQQVSTTPPALNTSSPHLCTKDLGLSPILLRSSGNGSGSASNTLNSKSLFKNLDDKLNWDDVISGSHGTSSPSTLVGSSIAYSSPWIKRSPNQASETTASFNAIPIPKPNISDFENSCTNLRSLDEGEVLPPQITQEDGDKTLRSSKHEGMSTDSLVLEEEEIVLENVRQDGGLNSTAFFIPLGTGSNGIQEKKSLKADNKEIKPSYSNEFNIEDADSISATTTTKSTLLGKKIAIPHAEPVVVVVAPQSPKLLPNPRTAASDAWIKQKNGINIGDSMFISKDNVGGLQAPSPRMIGKQSSVAPPITSGSINTQKKGKSSETNISIDADEEEEEDASKVPIVVVNMTAAESSPSPVAPGSRKQNSPSKIRQLKSKTGSTASAPDFYSPSVLNTPRDSNTTLVNGNRDSVASLMRQQRSSEPSFGERILVQRVSLNDSIDYTEMGLADASGMMNLKSAPNSFSQKA